MAKTCRCSLRGFRWHIWLVEVKSGRPQLSREQRQIRESVEPNRVSFKMIDGDDEIIARESAAER